MASVQRRRNRRALWQQLRGSLQQAILAGDVTALLIAVAMLLMPVLALSAAEWPLDLPITIPTLILSVLFGYLLARSPYNELFALLVSGVYGSATVVIIASIAQPGGFFDGLTAILTRSIEWGIAATSGGINQDNLVFSLVVALLFWFFGYNAAWHIFRIDRVWRVIVPPAMIMLVNMVVYTGLANLDVYLLLFVFMALLLIVRSNLDAREWDWYVNGVRVPRQLRRQFMWVGSGLALIALSIAWLVPTNDLQGRLDDFREFLANAPVQELAEFWSRLIEPIEAEGPATADYYGGDSLNLGGAIRLGDQVILFVDAPTENRYYWRSRVFEQYTGTGRWQPSATRRVPDLDPPLEVILNNEVLGVPSSRQQVTQTVTMNASSRLFYTAPQPVSINLAGRLDVLRTSGDQDDGSSPMNVSVIRPTRVLEGGMSYEVTSALSTASADDLRNAGSNYPEWVINPNTSTMGVNGRVAQLARQIVDEVGASNPYDQAKAIETYLRNEIVYNESIPQPPPGIDPIEWFLFELREGYCTYYATSMITMLRSLGVPARMAAGFAQGQYDAELGQYVVRERDAHTWVEVYFPGYGWVEFEPTAAQAPINREGDVPQEPQNLPDSSQSQPTQTPTPLPSPTPLPTSTPDASQNNEDANQPATFTPSPTPTPTATPIIVPTVAPPIQPPEPPPSDFLSFILPAIGVALLILLSIVLLIVALVLVWWWWEWRGMRGLSPISRAYARLDRYLRLIGLRSDDSQTPEERRNTIVNNLPQAERPVTMITRAYTNERYGRKDSPQEAQDSEMADQAWPEARSSILRRWLRRFMPWRRD